MTYLPDLYKEKLLLGEALPNEVAFLRASGFSSLEENTYRAKTEHENKEFMQKYPVDSLFSYSVRQGADAKQKSEFKKAKKYPVVSFAWFCAAGISAAVCMMFFLTNIHGFYVQNTNTDLVPMERVKGAEPHLFIYKKMEGIQALLLSNKAMVHEHDVLQLAYSADGAAYGAIISVDGNGVLTKHYPESGNKTAKLTTGGKTALDFAYQLDNAPFFERFILISSNTAISLEQLQSAFNTLKTPEAIMKLDPAAYLPQDCKISEVLLLKDNGEN